MRELGTRDERILLVEDEEPIRDLVTTALRFTGFTVETAATGPEGLALARNDPWHVLVLDVNLPGLDGFSLCRKLREAGDEVPVIFLTARDDPADLREGFTGGGDDYLTKPFSIEELVARVRAVLRRTGPQAPTSRLRYADLELDEDTLRVTRGGRAIQLSPTELKVLRYLLLNRERVLSKTQILDHVWSYDFGGNAGVVENYISYLRKKIDTVDPPLIHTVRGFGYVLRTDP
jgi:two-component system, OmpR family, response regulator